MGVSPNDRGMATEDVNVSDRCVALWIPIIMKEAWPHCGCHSNICNTCTTSPRGGGVWRRFWRVYQKLGEEPESCIILNFFE